MTMKTPPPQTYAIDDGFYAVVRWARAQFRRLGITIADPIIHHRRILDHEFLRKNGRFVKAGPFRGMELLTWTAWGIGSTAPKILGIYEKEILDLFEQGYFANRSTFVDIGAADGYYAIGVLVARIFSQTIAYEASPHGRQALRATAELNGVTQNLVINGAPPVDLAADLSKQAVVLDDAVILCDIEGGEFQLFNQETLPKLSTAHILIELHDQDTERSKSVTIQDRLRNSHLQA